MEKIFTGMAESLKRYSRITAQVIHAVVTVVDRNFIRLSYEGGNWRNDAGVSM